MDIYINVTGQKLKIASNLKNYVDGSQSFVKFIFEFADSTWSDMITIAQFQQGDKAYNAYLSSANTVYLPTEITEGKCKLILFGSKTNVKATTSYIELTIDSNNIVQNADAVKMTKTDYEQLVDDVSNKILKVENITDKDCNTLTERLYIAYGNNVQNKPDTGVNGYFINIPHSIQPALYSKQFWMNRSNDKVFTRYQENGEFSDWVDISAELKENISNKTTTLASSSTDTQYPSAKAVWSLVSGKENSSNKTTSLSNSSTNTQYPSAKAVWDLIKTKEESSNKVASLGNNPTDTQYPSAKLLKTITDGLLGINTVNITDQSCNNYSGKLIFAYGNNVSDKPATAANGYLVNISHPIQPTLYNKQIWMNRTDIKLFVRAMENGEWSDWSDLTYGTADVGLKEDKANKITEFPETPTDTQYPSAKLVYDFIVSVADETNEAINSRYADVIALMKNRPAFLTEFPAAAYATYIAYPTFVYIGETSGDKKKGYMYKVNQITPASLPTTFGTYEIVEIGSIV